MRKFLASACLTAVLSGCASGPALVGRPGLTMVQAQEMPAPTGNDLRADDRAYVMGPFDRLAIEVYGLDELRREVQADAAGRIDFPLTGALNVSGKTPQQLGAEIAERLQRYVRNPKVTVNVIETVNNVVTVDGSVKEPGLYPVLGQMTLMRAIASAKGLGEFAKLQEVVVQRTVEGKAYAALYDMRAIRQGIYPDPRIYSGDVVIVGDSASRRALRDLLQVAPALLTAPLVAVIQKR